MWWPFLIGLQTPSSGPSDVRQGGFAGSGGQSTRPGAMEISRRAGAGSGCWPALEADALRLPRAALAAPVPMNTFRSGVPPLPWRRSPLGSNGRRRRRRDPAILGVDGGISGCPTMLMHSRGG